MVKTPAARANSHHIFSQVEFNNKNGMVIREKEKARVRKDGVVFSGLALESYVMALKSVWGSRQSLEAFDFPHALLKHIFINIIQLHCILDHFSNESRGSHQNTI